MSSYLEKFRVRGKEFKNNIFYAPLAGYTDLPFRRSCLKFDPGLIFCEMVKIEALVRHDTNSFKLLDYDSLMHPIGAQICGSNPKLVRQGAKILEDLGMDWIDINCGCPVDKVTRDGSGSALLKNPQLIGEMVNELRSAVNLPISVKIRTGWDETSINAYEVLKIVEKAGVDAIIIHGRTRAQGYKGKSNLEIIKKCKEIASDIKVIGNGDLFDPPLVKRMFDETHCDGVLIARGMVGQPWLAQNIRDYYRNNDTKSEISMVKREMLYHFKLIEEYQIARKAVLDMRRMSCWYLQKCEGTKKLRIAITMAKSSEEIFHLIESFNWKEVTRS
jgi:tRNA-dihydrouridine synthase B